MSRFNVLQARALGDTGCVQSGIGVTIEATISCPAPAGGVPVTVTSSHPPRIGGTTTIPEGDRTATVEVIAGSQCGAATLTVSIYRREICPAAARAYRPLR